MENPQIAVMHGDRELLELAAKAIALPECGWMGGAFMYVKDNRFTDWNPLTDDGDAFRLAVKLRIGGKRHGNAPPELGLPRECSVATDGSGRWWMEAGQDEMAATRRAITRAAAEIGKAMERSTTDRSKS